MIVQCVDGYWYQNPRFETKLALVEMSADGCILYRRGVVQWKTAVRELTALGIKARQSDRAMLFDTDTKIIGGSLVRVTPFRIRLIKPIPVPHGYGIKIEGQPISNDEEILSFKVRKRNANAI